MFFWYFSYVISVQLAFHICIFYTVVQIPSSLATSFINENITNVLLSISCGLEAVDQTSRILLNPHFLITQTNSPVLRLLVLRKKSSRYLELSAQLRLFPQSHDSSSYWESTRDSFKSISFLCNR